MKAQKVLMWLTPLPTIIGTALALYKSYNGTLNISVPLLIVAVATLAIIVSVLVYEIFAKNAEIDEIKREILNLKIDELKKQNEELEKRLEIMMRPLGDNKLSEKFSFEKDWGFSSEKSNSWENTKSEDNTEEFKLSNPFLSMEGWKNDNETK